jgi:beta-lactam-binding protein with PASTA domain
VTSMPPPWDPDDEETRETRILPPSEREEETAALPPEERTRVRRAPPPEPAASTRVEHRRVGPPPPPGGPPPDRALWPWLLLLLGLVLAGAALAWFLARDDGGDEGPQTRSVPSVVRLTVADARRILTEQGFTVEVLRQASDEAPRGIVFAQRPEAGTELEEGGTVRIRVSVGPASTTVPDVVGSSEQEAVAALEGAGLEANVVRVPSPEQEGTVVAQAPQAGSDVRRGSTVRLNVSGGRGAATVPDVTGSPLDEAVTALRAAGLAAERRDVDSDEAAGTVVGQDPAAGTEAERGSTVRLDVSRGAQTVTVPDVVGLPEGDARSELEGLGFRVRVVRETAPDSPAVGIVLRQVPEAGREAPPNTLVTIAVGT